MGRLPYVPEGGSPEADRQYARLAAMGRANLNLYRMLANHPPALEAFLGMSGYVRGGSSLEDGLRELTILATAHEFGQRYEIAHHEETARKVGVGEEKLAAVRPGGDLAVLAQPERAAVEFSREVARTRTCGERTFSSLTEQLGVGGAMDVVVTAAWYHLCAVILNATDVDLEPGYGARA